MSLQRLADALRHVPGVAAVHAFDSVGSTNAAALELGVAGAPGGTVVVADTQTAGRGRAGRSWWSPPGRHVYASFILRPPWPAVRASHLPLDAAVAVSSAIDAASGLRSAVRWPNDVFVDDLKVAGILAELRSVGDRIDFVVIGVGIDVGRLGPDVPSDIAAVATSLSDAAGRAIDRAEVGRELAAHLLRGYGRCLERGGFDRTGWLARTATLGRAVRVSPPGGSPFEAVAVDITRDGALLVERDGRREEVIAGDVREIR